MRESRRPSSVVLSCFAVIVGLFALSSAGHSAPLKVLNWIPPTSMSLTTKSPCNFVAPTCDSPALTTSGTIPMWLSSDTASSVSYAAEPIAMVGKDPSVAKTGATTINTKIIPIVFVATGFPNFDPENYIACSPRRTPALNMVQSSPVFKTSKLLLNGVSLGTYQFGSQFQRANFATYTIKTASNASPVSPNYDISLQQVLANAEETVNHRITLGATTDSSALPYTIKGKVLTDTDMPSTWCVPVAAIEINDFDSLLQTQILPSLKGAGITPTTLPIILLSNVVMYDSTVDTDPQGAGCCILSYHNAYLSPTTGATANKLQTYIVANYDSTAGTAKGIVYTGAFPTAPNIVGLANAVAGWIDNPTTLNPTPSWPSSTSSLTGSFLEVAYPQCPPPPPASNPFGLGGKLTTITMANNFTYSVQDLAFKSWFYDKITNTGFNGQFSMFGTLPAANPSASCP